MKLFVPDLYVHVLWYHLRNGGEKNTQYEDFFSNWGAFEYMNSPEFKTVGIATNLSYESERIRLLCYSPSYLNF